MKAIEIRVNYGKNNKFIAKHWVVENAVEEFKAMWIKTIRSWGWENEVSFEIRQNTCEVDNNGTGEIFGYTVNGYDTIRVK